MSKNETLAQWLSLGKTLVFKHSFLFFLEEDCLYDYYPNKNAVTDYAGVPENWPRTSDESGCEWFCEREGCYVYTLFDQNAGVWANRCVFWSFWELYSSLRLDTVLNL